jgi:hypothetical protein
MNVVLGLYILVELLCKRHIPYPSSLVEDALLFGERVWWQGLEDTCSIEWIETWHGNFTFQGDYSNKL